jgi:O-antigen/teichoic acid export membrane protein
MRFFDYIRLDKSSLFRRNFFALARANVIALALPLLAMPFLTRIYDPSAFALLGVFTSAIGIVASFATVRMDWAMPNTRTDVLTASLFFVGASVLIVVVILMTLSLVVISSFPQVFPRVHELGWIMWFAPLILVAMGVRALLQGWLVKTGELSAVAHSTIVQSSGNVGLSFALGLSGLVVIGLVVSSAVSSWAGITTLVTKAGKRLLLALHCVRIKTVYIALRRHGKQASWSTGVSILNALTMSAPLLMFAALYSPIEVAWFVLMQRMIASPLRALSSALGQSFWSYAANLALNRNMRKLSHAYQGVTLRLAIASIPVIAVCLAGPLFVGTLLGEEEWSGAGSVLAAMTPLFVANLVFSPTNHLVVLHKQHWQFLVDGLRLGLMTIGILIAYVWSLGFVVAVFMSSLGAFFGYATIYFIQVKEHTKCT